MREQSIFGVASTVGRLIEMWAVRIHSTADVRVLAAQVNYMFARAPGSAVICADYSHLEIMGGDVLSTWLEVIRAANDRLERSAIIRPRHAGPVTLQLQGVFRQAGHAG